MLRQYSLALLLAGTQQPSLAQTPPFWTGSIGQLGHSKPNEDGIAGTDWFWRSQTAQVEPGSIPPAAPPPSTGPTIDFYGLFVQEVTIGGAGKLCDDTMVWSDSVRYYESWWVKKPGNPSDQFSTGIVNAGSSPKGHLLIEGKGRLYPISQSDLDAYYNSGTPLPTDEIENWSGWNKELAPGSTKANPLHKVKRPDGSEAQIPPGAGPVNSGG